MSSPFSVGEIRVPVIGSLIAQRLLDEFHDRPSLCTSITGLSLFASIGCATVTCGARDPKVAVTSNPPGAAVVIDGQPRGVTPTTVELSRMSDHEVVIQQTSYETAVVPINRQFNPWVIGNVVIGGLPGIIVDVATDATHC